LRRAYAIDERGRVLLSGDRGAFIATPVPEAPGVLLMLAGPGGLGLRLRRAQPGRSVMGTLAQR
jgi:hypothetical protein